MAKKIFVSYKYGDSGVRPIVGIYGTTKARDYVDLLQTHLSVNDHINKGEADGEDLSHFKEETIQSKLRDKIFDSSVTVVLISKNMKDYSLLEDDQWIPWEISYSLRDQTRQDRTSRTNALVAVILPDEHSSYDYFIQESNCPTCRTIVYKTETLFQILQANMFNRKQPIKAKCINGLCGVDHHTGDNHSYIYPIKWDNFILNVDGHINTAMEINNNIHEFELKKSLS